MDVKSFLENSFNNKYFIFLDNQILVPSDLEELYQLYSRDIDEGQLIHDLKSICFNFYRRS
jgi:hypothetical protein